MRYKIFFLLVLALSALGSAKHFWRGKLKPMDEVCAKWGDKKFNIEKFKSGTEPERAQMACDLLKNQNQFKGFDLLKLRATLGSHDGFYFTDIFPAYMIHSGASKSEESWQIVFLLNNDKKVDEIVVHKNCCDQ